MSHTSIPGQNYLSGSWGRLMRKLLKDIVSYHELDSSGMRVAVDKGKDLCRDWGARRMLAETDPAQPPSCWPSVFICRRPSGSPLGCFIHYSSHWFTSQRLQLTWLLFLVFLNHPCCCLSSVTQSCLTLCNPMDCSLPGSSVHGITPARIWKWVAISFPRGSSQPRDQTNIPCIGKWILHH